MIASTTGLSRAVVGRVLRGEIASLLKFDAGPEEGALPLYRGEGQPTNNGTAL